MKKEIKINTRLLVPLVFLVFLMSLSALAQYSYTEVSIMMRDGESLSADLYSIDTLVPKPTILIQTPYNKSYYRSNIGNPEGQVPFDSVNYNYLIVDWRGFYGSADADSTGYDRGLDGYDLVEWIASRPWSDGNVGTWGLSALGIIQFMTARHKPPHLRCCVPSVSNPIVAYTDYYYGGDYLKELTHMCALLGFFPESLVLSHYKHDIFWTLSEALTDYSDSISVPMLMVTGWYDHNNDGPLEFFYALRANSDPVVREKHKFVVGPWTHGGLGQREQGELTYPDGVDSLRIISFRIFDYYLRGFDNGYENEPVVRYYQMGENAWHSTDDWYGVSDRTDTLYFNQSGVLSESPPLSANPPDSFLYDPRDPSPSIGGNRFTPFNPSVVVGPRDQRDSVESRSDVVIYTTPELTEPLTIVGNIRVKLFVSSDCEDTDFGVRITDVYPDGRSMLIADGIRRMRFRNSYSTEQLIVPGDTDSVFVELRNIAYTFMPEHRLRIIASSSDYPIYDINLNNGNSLYTAGDTVVAKNKIYHQPGALSMVICKTKSGAGCDEEKSLKPNNFKASPTIFSQRVYFEYSLDRPARVELCIYDAAGRKMKTLVNKNLPAGLYKYSFNAQSLPNGVYFAHLKVDDKPIGVERLVYIK
jgi:predicted acyl esterase